MSGSLSDALSRLRVFRAAFPGITQRFAEEQGQLVIQALQEVTPRGAGSGEHLADSYSVVVEGSGAGASIKVRCSQAQKLRWLTQGTGIYGPVGHRIVPVQAMALYWPGAEHPYRSVRGIPGHDFVTPVLEHESTRIGIAVRQDLAQEGADLL